MKCSKDLRDSKYNEQTLRYIKRFSATAKRRLLLAAVVCCIAIIILLIVFFNIKEHSKITYSIFFSTGAALLISVAILFGYVAFRCRYYYDIAIDEESIFIRKRLHFYITGRFEIGNVLNTVSKKNPTAVSGGGEINFIITASRLRVIFSNQKISIKIPHPNQIAYILTNIAENPHSGINWGLAYKTS